MSLRESVSAAIGERKQALAEAVVARQYERQPALWKPLGDLGREKSVRDAGYHLTYLAEAIAAGDPLLFAEYMAWVKVLFAGLGFPDDVAATTLECTREVLAEALAPEQAALALNVVQAGLERLAEAPSTLPSFIQDDAPLAHLARQYLDALLRGERHEASRLILTAADAGVAVGDIYLWVFQPVQREIGRLWQMNRISVAQEHYCTAVTQAVMSQLYPRIFSTERVNRRLVATCVGGELHELGVRMVADFFEMAGWDTYYLGANTPTESVLRALEERRAEVLAVSATITPHVGLAAELIARVKATPATAHVQVMVGGYPFNVAPGLWRSVGADAYARDAQEAVRVASALQPARTVG